MGADTLEGNKQYNTLTHIFIPARICDPPPPRLKKYCMGKINNIIHWHTELVARAYATAPCPIAMSILLKERMDIIHWHMDLFEWICGPPKKREWHGDAMRSMPSNRINNRIIGTQIYSRANMRHSSLRLKKLHWLNKWHTEFSAREYATPSPGLKK